MMFKSGVTSVTPSSDEEIKIDQEYAETTNSPQANELRMSLTLLLIKHNLKEPYERYRAKRVLHKHVLILFKQVDCDETYQDMLEKIEENKHEHVNQNKPKKGLAKLEPDVVNTGSYKRLIKNIASAYQQKQLDKIENNYARINDLYELLITHCDINDLKLRYKAKSILHKHVLRLFKKTENMNDMIEMFKTLLANSDEHANQNKPKQGLGRIEPNVVNTGSFTRLCQAISKLALSRFDMILPVVQRADTIKRYFNEAIFDASNWQNRFVTFFSFSPKAELTDKLNALDQGVLDTTIRPQSP